METYTHDIFVFVFPAEDGSRGGRGQVGSTMGAVGATPTLSCVGASTMSVTSLPVP